MSDSDVVVVTAFIAITEKPDGWYGDLSIVTNDGQGQSSLGMFNSETNKFTEVPGNVAPGGAFGFLNLRADSDLAAIKTWKLVIDSSSTFVTALGAFFDADGNESSTIFFAGNWAGVKYDGESVFTGPVNINFKAPPE